MHLESLFAIAPDFATAQYLIKKLATEQQELVRTTAEANEVVSWRGEIIAANAEPVWLATQKVMPQDGDKALVIDLSEVRFMDSSGVGLMVRARKHAQSKGIRLSFARPQMAVLNVLRLARMEAFLLGGVDFSKDKKLNYQHTPA
jgi:anti-sigma B factor antagonist